MTDAMKDRPDVLTRRAPKPAPDERIDPVEVTPSLREEPLASTPANAKEELVPPGMKKIGRPSGRREITVPLGTRLSVDIMEVLDEAVAENGISIRAAIEQAIVSRWGKH